MMALQVQIPAADTHSHTHTDMSEVPLKMSECVCTYVCLPARSYCLCIYILGKCVYMVCPCVYTVCLYMQSVQLFFFPLMFLSLSMTRSSQVTNTEAWKGFYTLYRAYNQALFCADLRVSVRSVT